MDGQGALSLRRRQGAFSRYGAGLLPRPRHDVFPHPLKLGYTVAALVLIGLGWRYAEPGMLPWFWDVAVLATGTALWLERPLLAGMSALALLLPELIWNIGFLNRLLGGPDPFGLAVATFEMLPAGAASLAALMHLALPALLLWMIVRLGYDARALRAQTILAWSVLAASYLLGDIMNGRIGWSLAVGAGLSRAWLPGWAWLVVAMLAYPALVYLPTHLLLCTLFSRARGPADQGEVRADA